MTKEMSRPSISVDAGDIKDSEKKGSHKTHTQNFPSKEAML